MLTRSLYVALATSLSLPLAQAQDEIIKQADDPYFSAAQETLRRNLALRPIIGPAKNVILMIADGNGTTSVTATRIFEGQSQGKQGEEHVLSYEALPYLALSKTYNDNQQVSDSAGTMTAMISGVKNRAGVIGLTADARRFDCAGSKGKEVTTALELAEMIGMSTGIISTARITHATPAATYAHSPERNWEDDKDLSEEAKENGCKDIASQLIDFNFGDGIEVAMGGGRRSFMTADMADPEDEGQTGERQDGRDLIQEWLDKHQNSAYVWNKEQFEGVDPANVDHLLGLFNRSHMEYEADREQRDVGGEPSIAEMTRKAIEILSKNPEGYFLMVESGRVDHANHANNAYRMLTDGVAFAEAVATALEMTDPQETLVIVTADHEHVINIAGYPTRGNPILGLVVGNDQYGEPKSEPEQALDGKPYTTLGYYNGPGAPIEGQRPDLSETDTTSPDFIQPAAVPLRSETHAGGDVAIYARGPQAHLFQNTVEQNYIFHVMDYAASLRRRAAMANSGEQQSQATQPAAEADQSQVEQQQANP